MLFTNTSAQGALGFLNNDGTPEFVEHGDTHDFTGAVADSIARQSAAGGNWEPADDAAKALVDSILAEQAAPASEPASTELTDLPPALVPPTSTELAGQTLTGQTLVETQLPGDVPPAGVELGDPAVVAGTE